MTVSKKIISNFLNGLTTTDCNVSLTVCVTDSSNFCLLNLKEL